MLAVGERQRDLLAVRGEGREDGQGKFDGLKSRLRTTQGLPLLRDGGEQVAHGAMVTAIHEPDVLDGFRLPDDGGGDGSLLSVALQYGQRLFVDLQRDDALGTNQARPKGRALGPSAFL